MLKTLVTDPQSKSIFLNSLRRFVFGGCLVPEQNLSIIKVPAAASITQPGRSNPVPIQGPEDAKSEIYSLTGAQGLNNIGIGTISTAGTAITGVGTKFLTQLQVGDTISVLSGGVGVPQAIATVTSDTTATTTIALPAVAGVPFFFTTPIIADVSNKLFVEIEDTAWRRKLMNRDVPVAHVFGDNLKPLFVKESTLLETDQTLLLRFTNYSTAGVGSFGPQMEMRKWQTEALKRDAVAQFIQGLRERKIYCQPYWLTLDNGFVTLANGATDVTQFSTCTGDIMLVLFNRYGYAVSEGSVGDTHEKVALQFFDAKTDRALQQQKLTLNTCCGTAQNPFRLPAPIIVEPQTQLKVKIDNLLTNAPTDFYMTYHGVAVYTGSSYRGSALTSPDIMREAKKMYAALEPQVRPADAQ